MDVTLTLSVDTATALAQKLNAALAITPPVTPPPANVVPSIVVPDFLASRTRLNTAIGWSPNAGKFYSPSRLDDTNVWAIGFETGAFANGHIAFAEWVDQPTRRDYVVVRNRDGKIVCDQRGVGITTPTLFFRDTKPGMWDSYTQLDHGEKYTMLIWNAVTIPNSGRMVGELTYS